MGGLRVQRREGAVTFEVRVSPRASRSQILGVHEGVLKVALTAPPVDGAANAALIRLLAKALGVTKSNITIVRGERGRDKVLEVRGVDPSELRF